MSMYGLPITTERKKQLPKKAVYAKFDLKPSQRDGFDADVSRMDIVAALSPATLPAIAAGENIKNIYVLAVQLKRKDYDSKSIVLLSRLIPQNILFALQFEADTQFAVYHADRLIRSAWMPTGEAKIALSGLSMDAVWENIVKSIGGIEMEQGKTLTQQIQTNEQRAKTLAQIAALVRKMASEKQPRRKREYFEIIKKLKSNL